MSRFSARYLESDEETNGLDMDATTPLQWWAAVASDDLGAGMIHLLATDTEAVSATGVDAAPVPEPSVLAAPAAVDAVEPGEAAEATEAAAAVAVAEAVAEAVEPTAAAVATPAEAPALEAVAVQLPMLLSTPWMESAGPSSLVPQARALVTLAGNEVFYARPVEFESERASTCGGIVMIGLFDPGRLVFDAFGG